jgi:hypothetical protein
MRTALILALMVGIAAPALAQTKKDTSGACKPETMEACVKRQMGLRDAVSGITIQRGDAERFCDKRSQRC